MDSHVLLVVDSFGQHLFEHAPKFGAVIEIAHAVKDRPHQLGWRLSLSIGRNALLNALEHALESWNVAVIWSGARMRRAVFATSVPIFPSSLAAPENMSSYSLPIVFFGTSFPSDSHIDRLSVCKVRESAVPKQRLERQYPGQAAQLRALPSGI